MNRSRIQVLDCTLRDGAYIVDANFGTPAIKGIINKLQNAHIDIIECGWLKNAPHKMGTTFFQVPSDLETYLSDKNPNSTYTFMIDWDRYDLNLLPEYDGKSIDAIRVVFPQTKFREGIEVGKQIKEKGYKLYLQAANTLGYSNQELKELAAEINAVKPIAVSIVDTFGAMYPEDLDRIVKVMDEYVDQDIMLGFHSHNNLQLSFALTMQFVNSLQNSRRGIVVDASLCGMGRGAGNTTTELLVNFLNRNYKSNYDMNTIMDAIDTYMEKFRSNYEWGYSTPYFIAGMYCAHVNNIAYLLSNHRANAKDMGNIIGALSETDRKKYDYDLLERTYLEYQDKDVRDDEALNALKEHMEKRKVLLISPGASIIKQKELVKKYIEDNNPVVIGINAVSSEYQYDYLFFSNRIRYDYAKEVYPELIKGINKILTSNIKTHAGDKGIIINFNTIIKRGWEHFDNSTIMCLRLMNKLCLPDIALAGFDGFSDNYSESYFDASLPSLNPGNHWEELNAEIKDMFDDFRATTSNYMNIEFVTESKFNVL